jgi:hypothetical protein
MPVTSIAANLNETPDIEAVLLPKLTLNLELPVNNLSDTAHLCLGKIVRRGLRIDTGPLQKPPAQIDPNPMNILQ